MFRTIGEVKAAHPVWFSQATMRAFGSKVESPLFSGHWFITSEVDPSGVKAYTVRYADDEDIETVGEFHAYRTYQQAIDAMEDHMTKGDFDE